MSNPLDEKTQRRVMAEIDLMSKEQEIKTVALRKQYIMVMVRNTDMVPLGEWDMDRGYSIDYFGAAEALRKAQVYMKTQRQVLSNVVFKLEGGEL